MYMYSSDFFSLSIKTAGSHEETRHNRRMERVEEHQTHHTHRHFYPRGEWRGRGHFQGRGRATFDPRRGRGAPFHPSRGRGRAPFNHHRGRARATFDPSRGRGPRYVPSSQTGGTHQESRGRFEGRLSCDDYSSHHPYRERRGIDSRRSPDENRPAVDIGGRRDSNRQSSDFGSPLRERSSHETQHERDVQPHKDTRSRKDFGTKDKQTSDTKHKGKETRSRESSHSSDRSPIRFGRDNVIGQSAEGAQRDTHGVYKKSSAKASKTSSETSAKTKSQKSPSGRQPSKKNLPKDDQRDVNSACGSGTYTCKCINVFISLFKKFKCGSRIIAQCILCMA